MNIKQAINEKFDNGTYTPAPEGDMPVALEPVNGGFNVAVPGRPSYVLSEQDAADALPPGLFAQAKLGSIETNVWKRTKARLWNEADRRARVKKGILRNAERDQNNAVEDARLSQEFGSGRFTHAPAGDLPVELRITELGVQVQMPGQPVCVISMSEAEHVLPPPIWRQLNESGELATNVWAKTKRLLWNRADRAARIAREGVVPGTDEGDALELLRNGGSINLGAFA